MVNKIYKKFVIFLAILITVCISLSACTVEENPVNEPKILKVVLFDGDNFVAEKKVASVEKGKDVSFKLTFKEGYCFDGCSYNNYELIKDDNYNVLTIKNVKYSTGISLYTKEIPFQPPVGDPNDISIPEGDYAITYFLNGGTFIDSYNSIFYNVLYSKDIYPRVNTDVGVDKIQREGYVLTGWNTKEDGTGLHIGLKSRATVIADTRVELYAEWSKWSDKQNFEYVLVDSNKIEHLYADSSDIKDVNELSVESNSNNRLAVITKYIGANESTVTIPETIDGVVVAGIAARAFINHSEINTLILNQSTRFVVNNAFSNCSNLKNLYLYENIERCEEYAFGAESTIEKLYINAVDYPIYVNTENGQLANKMEMLINYNSEKNKMVIFGGCSMLYGINSNLIKEEYDEYSILNMAVIGGACATYQLDLIYQYMNEGDVLIHMPEFASEYQLLSAVDFDSRVFMTLESNYDLVSKINLTQYDNVFGAFNEYIIGKHKSLKIKDYSNSKYILRHEEINEYGDLIKERKGDYYNGGEPYQFVSYEKLDTSKMLKNMIKYYGMFLEKGINIYFGIAPVNKEGLTYDAGIDLYFTVASVINSTELDIQILMYIDDIKMDSKYFYDKNWHLSTEGANYYTKNIFLEYLSWYL